MYIKSNANNELVDTHYSPKRLRRDYPNTSFPSNMTDESLAIYYVFPLVETEAPSGDVVTAGPITLIGGQWMTTWSTRGYTAEELAAQLVELQTAIINSTQAHLDATAKAHGYDSMLSACSYANSSVPRYYSEGNYCAGLRDATWSALETIMGEVQAGTRPMPGGFDDISGDLPEVVWP